MIVGPDIWGLDGMVGHGSLRTEVLSWVVGVRQPRTSVLGRLRRVASAGEHEVWVLSDIFGNLIQSEILFPT